MILLKPNKNGTTPETWHIEKRSGTNLIFIIDTNGHKIPMSGNRIKKDGTAMFSVRCRELGCDFHSFVTLTEWGKLSRQFLPTMVKIRKGWI